MSPSKTLFTSLLGIALGGVPVAYASLAITNGDFQTNAPPTDNQADVVDWFDDSPSPTAWWEGAWYGPGVSPFEANKSCLGLSWMGGTSHWAYQSIGTNSEAINTLKLQFDAGSFTDAGTNIRNLGIKIDLYQSDGTFVGGDNVDIATASGLTLIDTFSVATGDLAAGQVVTGLTGNLDLSTANTTGELFLRISNYAAGTGEPWGGVDNLAIVYDVPTFSTQPTDHIGYVGDAVTLLAVATSDPAPTYQWYYSPNGSDPWTTITGETEASLILSPSFFFDNGYYRVVATNTNSSATSNEALVDLVYPDPVITGQPASTGVEVGGNVTLTVTATGLGELTYQWFKGSDPIDGEMSDTLELTGLSESGEYSVEITDDAAEADGKAATVSYSDIAIVTVFSPWSGLISEEPFDTAAGYVEGELPAQEPTIAGYTGAWTDIDHGDLEPAISPGSLIYSDPQYLGSSGDKASVAANASGGETDAANSGRVYRLLDAPLVANDSTSDVRYLSFLFQSGQETGATTYQTLALKDSTDTGFTQKFDIGITTNDGQTGTEYNFGTDNAYTSTGVAADTDVHLLVVRFELSATADSDSVTVWVDPSLGAGEPAGGVTVSGLNLTWDRLALSDYDGNSAAWDEIRWGDTFDIVTLNPNPSNTFGIWIAAYPGVGSSNGFTDDADGDGIKNGLESFFGTDPSVASAGITQVAKSGNTVTFQHPQNTTLASDVSAAYVWSTDLAEFHADGETTGGATVSFAASPDTPTAGITTVIATITGTVPAKLFVSVSATLGTP